jgi:hypothetical protein
LAQDGYSGRVTWSRLLIGAVLLQPAIAVLAPPAGAGARETGSVVVRLVTDPSPPGVSWSYSGVGSPFQLGLDATTHVVSGVQPGSYEITESPAEATQAQTLTALACTDPSGDTTTDLASGAATIAVGAGETITCTFTHRALGARPAADAVRLARRYAPVLRLGAGEAYRPLRLEDYLTRTVLRTGSPPRGAVFQRRPALFSLTTTPAATYLDVTGAEPHAGAALYPHIEQQLEGVHPRPTIYWHLVRQPATGRIAIEYWFFYLYNDFYDKHEADWEGVTVFLQNGAPIGVAYSQHQGRKWTPSTSASTQSAGPTVYVARGSHANYPRPGRYAINVCWTLGGRHCTLTKKVDDATGTGATLTPSAYDLQPFGGAGYTGSWGSGNYILGIGLTKDRIGDPRLRADYTNPFAAIPS